MEYMYGRWLPVGELEKLKPNPKVECLFSEFTDLIGHYEVFVCMECPNMPTSVSFNQE